MRILYQSERSPVNSSNGNDGDDELNFPFPIEPMDCVDRFAGALSLAARLTVHELFLDRVCEEN